MEKNDLQVNILGTSFSIRSGEKVEYLKKLIEYLQLKVEDTGQSVTDANPLKISLITCLNIIDELFKERDDKITRPISAEGTEIGEITKSLILKIDQCLSDNDARMSR